MGEEVETMKGDEMRLIDADMIIACLAIVEMVVERLEK